MASPPYLRVLRRSFSLILTQTIGSENVATSNATRQKINARGPQCPSRDGARCGRGVGADDAGRRGSLETTGGTRGGAEGTPGRGPPAAGAGRGVRVRE